MPHIGKTSLLKKLADSVISFQGQGNSVGYAMIELDFQLFTEKEEAMDFWYQLMTRVVKHENKLFSSLKTIMVSSGNR